MGALLKGSIVSEIGSIVSFVIFSSFLTHFNVTFLCVLCLFTPLLSAFYVFPRKEIPLLSTSYLGPKIWEQIPAEVKNKDSLDGFKNEIKKWKPSECPCRICKTFVPTLGFV